MSIWIVIANLILLISAVGTVPVWLQAAEISSGLAIALCFATLIVAMGTSLFVVKKATLAKKKSYLLYLLIPVAIFLSIIIFREYIINFLFDVLMPIGPGGMITPPEKMK